VEMMKGKEKKHEPFPYLINKINIVILQSIVNTGKQKNEFSPLD